MNHFLVTPWNIDSLDPEWLTGRQKLFERFCLPSVMSQTNKDFEWVIVADARTPQHFKDVVEAYPATVVYGDFEELPVPRKGVERPKNRFHRALQLEVAVAAPLKEYLETRGTTRGTKVITSRLDSDDAISMNHMEKIRTFADTNKGRGRFWLNLQRGYKYAHGNVYPIGALQNPFISFIEPQGDLLTAYQCCHQLAPKSGHPVIQVREGHPTWMQVIHGGNLMNKLMRVRGEMPFENVSDKFIIGEET